jgi:rRNA maturation RNase YbeY
MNRTHLDHDYYTDIITFDFTTEDLISGDLYISFERVQDNALNNQIQLETEIYRVIIHGVMHLCGYKDKTKKDALLMRLQEEKCLRKITF